MGSEVTSIVGKGRYRERSFTMGGGPKKNKKIKGEGAGLTHPGETG